MTFLRRATAIGEVSTGRRRGAGLTRWTDDWTVLGTGPNPTQDEMRAGLAGNLCRCTGYAAIYRAILRWSGGGAPSAL